LGKNELYLRTRVIRRIDSSGSSEENFAYYPKKYTDPINYDSLEQLHFIIYRDKKGRELSEYSLENGKKLEVETHYTDDKEGHQISKVETRLGNQIKHSEWEYDNKGRCIKWDERKWIYDSKENVTENDGIDFKNTFKIYYK
jgi:hypothetical protein